MSVFKNNPFIRILIFWISGILLYKFLSATIYFLLLFALLSGIYSLILFKKKEFPFDFTSSVFAGVLLILLAMWFENEKKPAPVPNQLQGPFVATILEKPVEKENSYQLSVGLDYSDSLTTPKIKAILYAEKSPEIEKLTIGNQITTACKLRKIENRGNPFEFDYAGYMQKQGYYYSAFVKEKNIHLIGNSSPGILLQTERFRNYLLEKLKRQIQSPEVFQVISALTLGYRKELSSEVKQCFASTGAMHVLAVSGLHVGMIFLFLSSLLAFLKRTPKGRFLHVLIIGLILWGYAMLTGFSPSVQRATLMFTIVLIGNNLKRPTSIYNSLAASAFILLLINPNLLFEVGFQLSYMAVGSIVFFYPRLEKLFTPKSWLIEKLWQLTCLSIAAQIGTFALSIFYFNQFPVYFLLSNFVVIPAAYLILGQTFAFFAFSFSETISMIIAKTLGFTTHLTITLLKLISQLPHALIEKITISEVQLFLLISAIILSMFFIKWKRPQYLFAILLVAICFQIDGLIINTRLLNQHKIIIYNEKIPTIHLINGRQNYILHYGTKAPSGYLYENVCNKLKLENPKIISINTSTKFDLPDLKISKKQVFFMNKKIDFQSQDKIILGTADEQENQTLVLIKPDHKLKSNPSLYYITRQGALVSDF